MRNTRKSTRVLLGAILAGIAGLGAPTAANAQAPTPSTPDKWGVVGRNTLGSPNAILRDGPYGRATSDPASLQPPPYGLGSLGIIVGNGTEKIEFGNETNFAGTPISSINILRYWILIGMDNLGASLPSITMEINPNDPAHPSETYSSLVYLPNSSTTPSAPATSAVNVWQRYDATATGNKWFATGATGTRIGCTLSSPCSFAQLQAQLPNAQISLSLGITKGRDDAFVGAVDSLRINNLVYDFEKNGVYAKAPLPTS